MKGCGWLWMLGVSVAMAQTPTIPLPPILAPVPAPTADQMNTQMPAAVTPTLSADEQATRALQKMYVIPIGTNQSLVTAQAQAKSLQQKGFSAFVQQALNGKGQVLVGPEVDMAHLQNEQKQLIAAKVLHVGTITAYTFSS